jgi:hypothetical protein
MIELRIDKDKLKKQKLFVATPMYGGMCAGMYARSLADLTALATHHGIQLQMYLLFNESLITRARNYCCDEFMRSDCTHMIFIDADIGFNAQDVIALLILQLQNPDYDIIGAPYPKKCIAWEKVKQAVDKGLGDKNPNNLEKYIGDFVFNPKDGQSQIAISEPVEVREIGTGFMMIRKETMKKFADHFTQYMYRPDCRRKIMQFFQAEIDQPDPHEELMPYLKSIANGNTLTAEDAKAAIATYEQRKDQASLRYLSEDYWFSHKAMDIGIKTWLCPWMQLQHMGSYVFAGSLADLAAAGAAATADPTKLSKKGK